MTSPTVSVVIVSRDRADALRLCLAGVLKLEFAPFEVVVVADAAGIAVAHQAHSDIKTVLFEDANISAARNAGINAAGGDIIAFIDDDAVPEPQWLRHLIAPFARQDVSAAGGFVRGRNGISFQWQARLAFADGTSVPFAVDKATVHAGTSGRAIKTEGTNMAFRRSVLAEIGGFDPRYHFYLDETDVNMRLAAQGAKTAIVPNAQVHHGFAASPRRTAHRVPRSLYDIAASSAVFSRKHDPSNIATNRSMLRQKQRNRVVRSMVAGGIVPADVRRLMRTFEAGWNDGIGRDHADVSIAPAPDFLPVTHLQSMKSHVVVYGRYPDARRVKAEAKVMAAQGHQVSAYICSFSALFHRVCFHKDGYWLQSGGQFGRADRTEPLFQIKSLRQRVAKEVLRVQSLREKL